MPRPWLPPDTGHIGFELAEQVVGGRMERRLVDAGQALLLGLQDRCGGPVVEQQFHRGTCRGWPARAPYPARAGGLWLCRVLVRFLFQAVVVPSGFSTRVQPSRWIMT